MSRGPFCLGPADTGKTRSTPGLSLYPDPPYPATVGPNMVRPGSGSGTWFGPNLGRLGWFRVSGWVCGGAGMVVGGWAGMG